MALRSYTEIVNELEVIYAMWKRREMDTGQAMGLLKSIVDSAPPVGNPSKRSVRDVRGTMRLLQLVQKFDNERFARESEDVQLKRHSQNVVQTREANRGSWCTLL